MHPLPDHFELYTPSILHAGLVNNAGRARIIRFCPGKRSRRMAHIPRVYLPDAAAGEERPLGSALAHHLTRVLRLGDGADLFVFDGSGHEFDARLAGAKRDAAARIGTLRRTEAAPRLAVELWVGISRRTRMEWTLEKAVELGVAAIHPVLCEHSKTRLDGAQAVRKLEHWQAIVISAAAQCGRARLPDLSAPRPLADLWEHAPEGARLFLSPEAGVALTSLPAPKERLVLLVGPESGFSELEARRAQETGWQAVKLGPRILRAETAGPAALAAIQALWGDWREGA